VTITLAADVRNPLLGPHGAAAVYSPQKGASPRQVWLLDQELAHLAELWRRDLACDVADIPGAGAAGGLGGGAMAMLHATPRPGIELVLDAVGFDNRLRGTTLVLTGEGRLDGQTLSGKAVAGVAAAARSVGIPVIALAGSLGDELEHLRDVGVTQWRAIGEGLSVREKMARAAELLEAAAADIGRELCEANQSWRKVQP
jgi:glycerate kinase